MFDANFVQEKQNLCVWNMQGLSRVQSDHFIDISNSNFKSRQTPTYSYVTAVC